VTLVTLLEGNLVEKVDYLQPLHHRSCHVMQFWNLGSQLY